MESEPPAPFPASLEAVWGLRGRPHKGPKRGLSLDGIVAAAIAVADAEGVEAVSMSRVAKEVGASTMALYRYVATKDELLMLMVDGAIGPPVPLSPDAVGWRAGLEHWAMAMRAVLSAHLWAVPLVAAHGPPATPNQLAWLDQCLQVLSGTRLDHGEKIAVSLLVSGQIRSELTIVALLRRDPAGTERRMAGYGAFLRRVTQDGRLPALRAAVTHGAFDDLDAEAGGEAADFDDFAFGLQRALDGVAAYLGE
ncbi:TetR/AcrR family transcriptional regulator C-terminal domain-containing protein [Streptomyces sp. G44]|uniref:TetR/AcrR family transcriptional regulator n=1 Tax=Streptomyces sp. G44 TaxID=2807632 RepID=UPI001961AE0D|nr:TetR/AcrR family transcriptional regulator [Streptomyces sp. G44]MBM7171450.1 TetR/AcrR family transcriptional regulator C-terminal domain-containing protein [Streptomyces sp. G44]